MTIPDYQSLMRPLLAFGADGSEKDIKDAIAAIAAQLKLSDAEIQQLLPSGKQTIFSTEFIGREPIWIKRERLEKPDAPILSSQIVVASCLLTIPSG